MTQLYTHTFFKWWTPVDLDELAESLKINYIVTRHKGPTDKHEISLYKDERDEIEARSDNMVAFLSRFRATISQLQEKPLNLKDIELRDIIKDHYPRDRPTPFPWEWNPEPKLKVDV